MVIYRALEELYRHLLGVTWAFALRFLEVAAQKAAELARAQAEAKAGRCCFLEASALGVMVPPS